ncbi:hypothetical protein [uncultured Draconibacterium sp.]|uniref:hypothetical protein n=1 Tax=uncultured Draconibacterium sp. TaxID=1573823 RepID=UPI0025EFF50E|nr:hypothetical protein [uncultured Draconibacterium sp.]
MAKEKEKKLAYMLFVEQRKTAKEISQLVNVSEKTLSNWINAEDGRWKKEQRARNTSPGERVSNIEQIISNLADDRLRKGAELVKAEKELDHQRAAEIRQEISKIDDAVSKWNKTLRDINKESQVPLATYLEIMQTIFQALQAYDPKLFMQTIDFQEKHIHDASLKLSM